MTQETDLAWLAGIVDGEGCISSGTPPHFHIGVMISNTCVRMMRRIEEIGIVTIRIPVRVRNKKVKTKYAPHHMPQFLYQVSHREDVERFLKVLLPYLISKKEEAEVALGYIEERKALPHRNGRYSGIRPELLQLQHDTDTKLRALKRRDQCSSS